MECTQIYLQHFKPCNKQNMNFVFDLQLFAGDKTEDPTSKRKSDAKKKGQVGRSREMGAAFVLIAGFAVMKVLGFSVYKEISDFSRYIFSHPMQDINEESIMQMFIAIVTVLAKTALPIMGVIMIVGLAVSIAQVGIIFSTEPISFKPDRLNPITGFGRIFSKKALVELLKSVMKIIVIGFFIVRFLKDEIMQMPKLIYLDLLTALTHIGEIILDLAFQVCIVILIIAILDLGYQKWQTFQDMKMSKQEVKDEFKQMEGDPQIKNKRRQKQRQMAMSRMMKEVPQADVVITNPTHFAVALKYSAGMQAPMVIAKGQDFVAQKIKDIARESGVTIVENRSLARTLYASVDIGGFVPQELYKSVAEVLAYVYKLKNRRYA